MGIEEAFFQELKSVTAITNVLENRIYNIKRQDEGSGALDVLDYPAMDFRITTDDPVYDHDGDSGLIATFIQTTFHGLGSDPQTAGYEGQVLEAFRAVDNHINGFRGTLASGTTHALRCDRILRENKDDFFIEESNTYRRTVDYKIWHEEG